MPAEARKSGLLATIYLDIYDNAHGAAANRIRILDAYNWEILEDVQVDDATIKGEVANRYKVSTYGATVRAQRYVQAAAVFSREVLNYMNNPTPANLGNMGTTNAVDSGGQGTAGNMFGGSKVATVAFGGTNANVRPPVAFDLYVLDNQATAAETPIKNVTGAAPPGAGYSFYSGQGYLMRGGIRTGREELLDDTLEIMIDGPLNYFEST